VNCCKEDSESLLCVWIKLIFTSKIHTIGVLYFC